MAAKMIALALFAFFALAYGAAAPAAQTSPLEEVSKHAEEFSKAFSTQLSNLVSAKNTEEFNKVLKTSTDSLIAHVTQLSTQLDGALKETDGKAKTAFAEASTKLGQIIEDLKKQNPQVEQQTKELGDKIKTAVQNAVQETDKLAKQIGSNAQELGDKVAPTFKKAYDDFVKGAELVKDNIHEAANKA